jgi:hypothetical protein
MWDDKINKKIKDAADQYHPAYDDNAWDKMELLLNEHLPVKDNERKKYLFILLVLLFLGGSFFALYEYNTSKNKVLKGGSSKNMTQTILLPEKKSYTNKADNNSSKININSVEKNIPESRLERENNNRPLSIPGNNFTTDKKDKLIPGATEKKPGKGYSKIITNANAAEVESRDVINNSGNVPANDELNTTQGKKNSAEQIINNDNSRDAKKPISDGKDDTTRTKEVLKSDVAKISLPAKKSTKTNNKFSKNFAIDISMGPDVSIAGLHKAGKITIGYGVGLSYSLSNKFTVHTGFYIADKIYSANKNEYHLPPSNSYNYLFNIDANCKVYEIPVTVSYNFKKVKNHQWFIGGGLSSYLMKKESYDYYYKYPSGYVDTKSWSISNKNQHYFAILDISAGYQYNFNKRVSLIGEPYLKIPMEGVGAGKVKLNSGGILFTLSVKPFYKK